MDKQLGYKATADTVLHAAETAGVQSAAQADVPSAPATWRDFLVLTKPGIIFSNLITAFGGFWIASAGTFNLDWFLLLIYAMVGTALVLASGTVLNNYLDRDMDAKMERTKKRATVKGTIKPSVVLAFGIILGVVGLSLLYLLVNPLTALLGITGMFLYVWIYTVIFKRTSVWGTFAGSFSGAVPPVMGYVAVTGSLDMTALILYLILFLWQPPHFWALGIRRKEEYRAAGYPLLPVVKGNYVTKVSMMRYIVLLVPVSQLLFLYGGDVRVGPLYFFAATIMGLIWAFMCYKGFKTKDDDKWAKGMFVYSVNYLTLLFLIMVVDSTIMNL
ncbi:heme o synthase [Paenibacillus sp. FJAT-26967]|uniref:heme o synthase n=1 Tax=Paenibacillus sp. FJAT-26967 TaxID=1729690 RepID=UPI000838E1B9|nr:heme o synthase [Paenibacillus sp. FJAT-26967]